MSVFVYMYISDIFMHIYMCIYMYIYMLPPPPVIYHFRPLKPNLTVAAVKS